jgi:hypothetical protein
VEKLEPYTTFGVNAKLYKYMDYNMEVPKKLKIELSYGPAIPLTGSNQKKN